MNDPAYPGTSRQREPAVCSHWPKFKVFQISHRSLRQARNALIRRVVSILYYLGLCAWLLAVGGSWHLFVMETPGPTATTDAKAFFQSTVLLLTTSVLVCATGVYLFRRNRKWAAFGTVWCLILVPFVLYVTEFSARPFVPDWPASGLHGVAPEVGRTAWARAADREAFDLNDWGQRDRVRTIVPDEHTYRIALVGDSFLEESSTIPLSLRVEQKLKSPDIEVLNLGVSATDPDEYYYRTLNIALPLDIDHCVVCVFAGNDFSAPERTLETYAGIVAVSPRGSMFSSLGLHALNFALMNRRRPVLQAWFAAGDLHAQETQLGESIATADDQQLRDLLYSLQYSTSTPQQRSMLASRLNRADSSKFFEMLRNPDRGLFRSYYLTAALWSASVGDGQWVPLAEDAALYWVTRTAEVCRERGVALTLVVIPEAFQVDARMVEQWSPLTDMRQLTDPCRRAAGRLVARAQRLGISTIDLYPVLAGVPGTYLNLDGHWSDLGVEMVADVLAKRLLPSGLETRTTTSQALSVQSAVSTPTRKD